MTHSGQRGDEDNGSGGRRTDGARGQRRRAALGALAAGLTAGAAFPPVAAPVAGEPGDAVPAPDLARLGAEGIVQPFWSADGSRVLFYDQPAPGQGGTWAADPVSGAVTREGPDWGVPAARGTLVVSPRPAQRDTAVLHLPSGRRWTLPTANSTVFSPDGTVVAYPLAAVEQPGGAPPAPAQGTSGQAPPFVLTAAIVSGADAQGARGVELPVNGSILAWLPAPDGTPNARLLLSGRRAPRDDPSIVAYDLRDGALAELGRARHLAGVLASPDGAWVAYVAMWNADPAQDGLWVARTDGGRRRRLDLVGSYRWADEGRLLVLPVRASAADGHELWQVEADSGAAGRLTDPARTPFRVANADWEVSPGGRDVVFVSADDRGLWRLTLPAGLSPASGIAPPAPQGSGGTGDRPYRIPFAAGAGPAAWYAGQWYGVTTGGYRLRSSVYSQGQGIHFGVDLTCPCGTEVLAVAPGRVVAVDGDYGSAPHNVVLQLADGNLAVYGHLVERSRHVVVGQPVQPGQVVGHTGDSVSPYDCTHNPHVHLEIRRGGRAVATNPVTLLDANWDDAGLGAYPGSRFQRDLDAPRRHQFLDDQPDIRFGGPILTNFARPWPP